MVKFTRVPLLLDWLAADSSLDGGSGSSSTHNEDQSADLSDLVTSFLEDDGDISEEDTNFHIDDIGDFFPQIESNSVKSEFEDSLKNIFDRDVDQDVYKRSIIVAVEKAWREIGCSSRSPEFKRRLAARLRTGGFNSGVCKSKWDGIGNCPAGNYDYVDVISGDGNNNRYIIETFLVGEFTIARPTASYVAAMQAFPVIFVGKSEELKQVVRVMCTAMRKSLRSVDMHVPPWRRLAYMQAKWFGYYKRAVDESPIRSKSGDLAGKRLVGFGGINDYQNKHCREDFSFKGGGDDIGNSAVALAGRIGFL